MGVPSPLFQQQPPPSPTTPSGHRPRRMRRRPRRLMKFSNPRAARRTDSDGGRAGWRQGDRMTEGRAGRPRAGVGARPGLDRSEAGPPSVRPAPVRRRWRRRRLVPSEPGNLDRKLRARRPGQCDFSCAFHFSLVLEMCMEMKSIPAHLYLVPLAHLCCSSRGFCVLQPPSNAENRKYTAAKTAKKPH